MDAVDLHVHTYYSSDGDHSPDEILRMSADRGLRAISIADHDEVEGALRAVESCESYRVEVIPNVEITTFMGDKELHVLSYFVDLGAPELLARLERIRRSERTRIEHLIELLGELGIDVTYEEVAAGTPRGVPKTSMVIKAAILNGRNAGVPLLDPYVNGPRSDQPYHNFFLDHMRPGGIAHVEPSSRCSTLDAIELVLASGGLPVLAHPGGSLSVPDDVGLIDRLRSNGLAGVEVYSSYHSEALEAYFLDYCRRHGLAVTCGSDFHGPTVKPNIELGSLSYNRYTLVDQLRQRVAEPSGCG